MKKKFITNLAFLLLLNILIKPFWIFGIDRTVQNIVGANEYGFYFTLFNFSLLFNIFLDFGITNFNNRNIARHNQLLSKHFSNIIGLKFILGLFYLVLVLLSSFIIDYSQRQIYFLLLLSFNQFLSSLILYMRSSISALHFFKIDSLISVLDRTIMIILCSILLFGHFTDIPFKIEWLIYSQTIAYFFTALVAFFVILSKSVNLSFKIDIKFLIVILRKSYPYALLILLMTSYTRIDTVMLERLLPDGDTQSGIYAHGYRILDAASQYAYLFAALLLPIFARMLKNKDNISHLVKLSFLLLVIPSVSLSVSSFFYSKDIIYALYESHIEVSAKVFSILILGFVPISISYIFGTLLTANGSLRALNFMALAGFLTNIILNCILIPKYQAYGAAIASLVTQVVTAIIQMILAVRILKFNVTRKFIFLTISYTFLIFISAYLINNYVENRMLGFSAIILFSIVLAGLFKLINIKFLYKIIKYDL